MISKLIKQKIEDRFGHPLKYGKQCDALAAHITQACKVSISASTLRRLLGFVKGHAEPRLYTLDILAEYTGHKSWEHLLSTLDNTDEGAEKVIEKLKPAQIKAGQTIQVSYEPKRQIGMKKSGNTFKVVTSNEKKLLLNDQVEFKSIELHYPLTFTHVIREGKSIGRLQLAGVSGVTAITKD